MVHLNMIDTIGSGIKKMFIAQRNRFFPLPDYDLSEAEKVKVTITGKVLDENYTRLLIHKTDLELKWVILLDKVQKSVPISDIDAKLLKSMDLIEGRKPNYHVSAHIAAVTGEKAAYIRNRGFKDQHYKDLILEYIGKYGSASKADVDKLLLDILPGVLDIHQRQNKVRNMLYAMSKRDKSIVNQGTNRNPRWMKFI
jgi:ATP-dependent DNA helicase RecG